ncbi:hypothetical protein GCM10027085_42040 [Spirosoma aerophilum]
MTQNHHFNEVTLLITHYNRSRSLERLLSAFQKLNCSFADIVVSDDGSLPEHKYLLQQLQCEYNFQLITTPINRGLGNNINKGQDAVRTPYTLYVQEDFVPKPDFALHFSRAMGLMNENETLDIVRFYAYFKYPYLKPYAPDFSEMVFKPMPWHMNHLKFYYYSDHPHLRRSTFFEKFGRYVEGRNGDITEFSMCLSFLKNGGKGLFFEHFTSVFDQANSSSEPSTAVFRKERGFDKRTYLFLRKFYLVYRFMKNTFELTFFDSNEYKYVTTSVNA